MQTIRSNREGEVFLAFAVPREQVPQATRFRSTWLSSSLTALRDRGLMDRYLGLLPAEYHRPIIEIVAGVWLPIDVCIAHYRACDGLELSKREMWEIGDQVTRRVHGTSLALALRLATQAGVTPWTILAQLNRLWERIWVGGGVAVYKRGPKEAVVELIQWRPAGIPYLRGTMPAVVSGIISMFCAKAYVTELPALGSSSSMGVKLQWA
jgi:hypothetical protein